MNVGSRWFKRFYKECKKISPHIRFKRIKYGFYRLYYVGGGSPAYIGECYKEMPEIGYEWHDIDPRLDSRNFYEEYEDRAELTRKVKNFVEGYWENLDKIRTRVFMMKHSKEHYKQAVNGYKQVKIR